MASHTVIPTEAVGRVEESLDLNRNSKRNLEKFKIEIKIRNF